jgi:hypothetical protein
MTKNIRSRKMRNKKKSFRRKNRCGGSRKSNLPPPPPHLSKKALSIIDINNSIASYLRKSEAIKFFSTLEKEEKQKMINTIIESYQIKKDKLFSPENFESLKQETNKLYKNLTKKEITDSLHELQKDFCFNDIKNEHRNKVYPYDKNKIFKELWMNRFLHNKKTHDFIQYERLLSSLENIDFNNNENSNERDVLLKQKYSNFFNIYNIEKNNLVDLATKYKTKQLELSDIFNIMIIILYYHEDNFRNEDFFLDKKYIDDFDDNKLPNYNIKNLEKDYYEVIYNTLENLYVNDTFV